MHNRGFSFHSVIGWIILSVFLSLPGNVFAQRGIKIVPARPAGESPATSKTPSAGQFYAGSYALIVGVSHYTQGWPNLPGVLKDVDLVKTALEQQGFQVVVAKDTTREEFEKALSNFIRKYGMRAENRLLFYFAGHGYTHKQAYGEDQGYIVPSGTPDPNRDLDGFLVQAISMDRIEVFAKRVQSRHALFLFDSCFSGSIFNITRALDLPESIDYKLRNPVRQFITSGGADEEVSDDSIFRGQFIAALNGEADFNKDGFVTGSELGMFIQDSVVNYSHGMQHPQYGKLRHPILDKGDYLFPLPTADQLKANSSRFDEEMKALEKERRRWMEKRKQLKEARVLARELRGEASGRSAGEGVGGSLRNELQKLQEEMQKIKNPNRNFGPRKDQEMCWDSEEFAYFPCDERKNFQGD